MLCLLLASKLSSLHSSMSSRVRVLNVTHVLPDHDQAAAAAYSPPQPLPDDGVVKLSFMDAMFVDRVMPMRRLFFYEGPGVPPFPCVLLALRSSLAVALAVFSPLAGKLAYRASTGDVVVDCSPEAVAPGVRFVEAEYDGSVRHMRRLAGGDEGSAEALKQLGPELDAGRLPAPVLAVQVTRPAVDGGERAVMVGVAVHHAVADGHSVWQFMKAWSAVSRACSQTTTAPDVVPPMFDRTPIFRYPRAEEVARKILHTVAPSLPVVKSPSPSSNLPVDQRRRTFLLSADEIQSLKRRILAQAETVGEKLDTHPSTYVAVFSLMWASIVRAKSVNPAEDAYFLVAVDFRRRVGPPVDDHYFGNCVIPCVARAAARELCDDGAGLARAAAAILAAIRAQQEEDDDDPVRGMERWLESWRAVPRERLTVTASSNRFMAYETDFGWGAPSRVELVSLFARELVMLLGAADGGVQVTVTLGAEHMDGFVANLMRLSGRENEA